MTNNERQEICRKSTRDSRKPANACLAISQQSYHKARKALKANTRQGERERERVGERECDKSSKQKSNNNKILYCSVNNSIVSLNRDRDRDSQIKKETEREAP